MAIRNISSQISWICKGGLAIVLAACLIALVVNLDSVLNREANSARSDFESMDVIEQQAWQLAEEVVGTNKKAQEQFVAELLDFHWIWIFPIFAVKKTK